MIIQRLREKLFYASMLKSVNDIVNNQMLWEMDTPYLWHRFEHSLEMLFRHFMEKEFIKDFKVSVYGDCKRAFVNFIICGALKEGELSIDFSGDKVEIFITERHVYSFLFQRKV